MGSGTGPRIEEVLPPEAWQILASDRGSRLIDVRTLAEWNFVGMPDISALGQTLICVEWNQFPGMSRNPRFVEAVAEGCGSEEPSTLLFICRSGARSLQAAGAVAAHFEGAGKRVRCLNVAEGFEGDLDQNGHRGQLNGWKHRNLAWRQS
ncbi:MAG: rhodanese-like domain-containing protein [Paracoccaceae bacterium]|nr:rhodanese-like domain-containing protein [Paracoccaceae bacterium]